MCLRYKFFNLFECVVVYERALCRWRENKYEILKWSIKKSARAITAECHVELYYRHV